MKSEKKELIYNISSLVCGIWFLLTGWFWLYAINIIISYPFFLIGIFFWKKGKEINKTNILNKFAAILLILGFISSMIALYLFK